MMRGIAGLLIATAGISLAAQAAADRGLGPLYGIKYQRTGIVGTERSDNGSVELTIEGIQTINCGGCDTIFYGPGRIFHLRNVSKRAVCASFNFTPDEESSSIIERWGSGVTFYLKPGQRVKKIAGLYSFNPGNNDLVDLGYTWFIRTTPPTGKKSC